MPDERTWRSRGRGRGRGRGGGTTVPIIEPRFNATVNSHQIDTISPPNMGHRKRMDLIASVSRSSGLEKDGDDLKNHRLQEEYRKFIEDKANDVISMQIRSPESEEERKQRIEKQENLLILYRKLREGVSSSSRNDDFALEVYETSLYHSVICESPKQTVSIISHLFLPRIADPKPSQPAMPSPSIYSVLASLLHYLTVFYPSQSAYHQHLASISETLLPRESAVSLWLYSVTKSIRMRNYAKFSSLSQKTLVSKLLETPQAQVHNMSGELCSRNGTTLSQSNDLALKAVLFLIEALRKKVADTSWGVIRSAYREFSCDRTSVETKTWLERMLSLDSFNTEPNEPDAEAWLEAKASCGHVRRKEGVEGRWVVCKVR